MRVAGGGRSTVMGRVVRIIFDGRIPTLVNRLLLLPYFYTMSVERSTASANLRARRIVLAP